METAKQQAIEKNDKNAIEIERDALPICCPLPDQVLWNQHPRVYIAFNAQGLGACPYCGNQFSLIKS